MKKFFLVFGLIFGLIALGAAGASAQNYRRGKRLLVRPIRPYNITYFPALRWKATLGMTENTAPAIADLDLDGALDIVFPAVDNHTLYRLTDGGAIQWKFSLPAPATAGVTLGDVDRDGTLDILVACGPELLCIDARGRQKWRFKAGDDITSFPTVADLDLDGAPEVLVGANDNFLHVLNSQGREKWSFKTKSWIVGGVAVADLSGDARLEIVFGSLDRHVFCLDAAGKELWKYETGDWVQSSPCIGDLDHDGSLDVVIASDDGQLYCLSRLGTLKWQADLAAAETRMKTYLAVADLDGDGTLETIAALPDGSVHCFTGWGDPAWTANVGAGSGAPLIADLNGDSYQDVLVASKNGRLTAFNAWGNVQWTSELGQTIEATPALADFDGDGKWEIYVANLMREKRDSGFFSAFEVSAKGGVGLWTSLKGDPYRTGFAPNARDYGRVLKKGGDYATSWEPFGVGDRPKTGVSAPRKLRVTMLPLDDARGNRDGALDPGETAWVRVQVQNFGRGASYDSLLSLDLGRSFLSIDRTKTYFGWIAPGATALAIALTYSIAPPCGYVKDAL